MPQELMRDGKLDRQATAEALRTFLEDLVRASGLELKVTVRAVSADGTAPEGQAEVLADLDGRDKEILLERGADVLKARCSNAFKTSAPRSRRIAWSRPSRSASTSAWPSEAVPSAERERRVAFSATPEART